MSYKVKIESIDSEEANKVEQKLRENDGFCPCKLIKTANTKCMCKEFRETLLDLKYGKDPNASAICHCGLYLATIDGVIE